MLVNGKTGTRHIPLINSIPYLKDYLDHEHPQPRNPNAVEKNHDNPTIKVVADREIGIAGSKSKQFRPPTLPPSLADSQEDTVAAVFSSQRSQFADYTTWKGIENKTGIEREHAYDFVLKELLDNAVDYLETQHNTAATAADIPPEIHVTIKKIEPQEKLIRIVVSNSNYDTSTRVVQQSHVFQTDAKVYLRF